MVNNLNLVLTVLNVTKLHNILKIITVVRVVANNLIDYIQGKFLISKEKLKVALLFSPVFFLSHPFSKHTHILEKKNFFFLNTTTFKFFSFKIGHQ